MRWRTIRFVLCASALLALVDCGVQSSTSNDSETAATDSTQPPREGDPQLTLIANPAPRAAEDRFDLEVRVGTTREAILGRLAQVEQLVKNEWVGRYHLVVGDNPQWSPWDRELTVSADPIPMEQQGEERFGSVACVWPDTPPGTYRVKTVISIAPGAGPTESRRLEGATRPIVIGGASAS